MSFDLQFGTRLSPQVLFGVDLSWFAAFDNYAAPFDESHLSLNIGTVTANATLFPLRTGPFLRAGLGFARFWARATFPNAPTLTPEAEGFAATAGVGYAVQLGQRFALTMSLDVSGQTYPDADPDAPDTSSFWTLRGGVGWY
jgi:hypothetical protein